MSVFDYANVHLRQKGLPDGYVVRVVAAQAGLVQSDTLMGLQATHTLAQVEADGTGCTVLLVGSRHIEQVLAASGELVDWVARVAPQVGRMIALCSEGGVPPRTGAWRACWPSAFPALPWMPMPSMCVTAVTGLPPE